MKKQVKKTDAIKFLNDRGINESVNNIRTIKQTALLMEEYAVFKLKEEARWLFIEQSKAEIKEIIKDNLSCHVIEGLCGLDNKKRVDSMLDEIVDCGCKEEECKMIKGKCKNLAYR